MSQIIKDLSVGPVPPSVATTYQTDDGNAVPATNILIIHGTDSTEDENSGIVIKGGVAGTGTANEVDIVLTNKVRGTGTTVGATTADLFTFSLGATPSTFFFNCSVVEFNASTPAGASFDTFSCVRTDGVSSTVIDDTDSVTQADAALITSSSALIASGNNVIFRVTGVAGLTINWNVSGEYIKVS